MSGLGKGVTWLSGILLGLAGMAFAQAGTSDANGHDPSGFLAAGIWLASVSVLVGLLYFGLYLGLYPLLADHDERRRALVVRRAPTEDRATGKGGETLVSARSTTSSCRPKSFR
jgi:hypothetical protein